MGFSLVKIDFKVVHDGTWICFVFRFWNQEMFGSLGHLTFPHDHEIESSVSTDFISRSVCSYKLFCCIFWSIRACNPTLAAVAALSVVDVDTTLLNFVLKPTSGNFTGVLFGVERFLVGQLWFLYLVTWADDLLTPWEHRSACP